MQVKRPLIFVAHSMGGLVVEQALLISRGSAQQHVKDVLESTIAIAFMGTPHMGSSKASLAAPLTRLTALLRRTNKKLVDVLAPNSEVLATIQQEFHTMLEDRSGNDGKRMSIYCFYEEKAVIGIGEVRINPFSYLVCLTFCDRLFPENLLFCQESPRRAFQRIIPT
jgi:hypothetical protein